MNTIEIDITTLDKNNLTYLRDALVSASESLPLCTVIVPLPSINSTQDPVEIASNYLDALVVGFQLNNLCTSITTTDVDDANFDVTVNFICSLKSNISYEFMDLLANYYEYYESGDPYYFLDSPEYTQFWDNPSRYLIEYGRLFPALADSLIANYLHYYKCDDEPTDELIDEDEFVDEMDVIFELPPQPEYCYGYWVSFEGLANDEKYYVSAQGTGIWIIPTRLDAVSIVSSSLSLQSSDFKQVVNVSNHLAPQRNALIYLRVTEAQQCLKEIEEPRVIPGDLKSDGVLFSVNDSNILIVSDNYGQYVVFMSKSY